MMGYTHAVIGAGGAVAFAAAHGAGTPGDYAAAAVAGALGGVAIDIDVEDRFSNPKVTDGLRSKLAVVGFLAVAIGCDFLFKTGVFQEILSRQYLAMGGAIAFAVLMAIGYATEHRTFTHSLLFSALTSGSVYCVYPKAAMYYLTGCLLHLLLDMLNYKYEQHGIWLLYPIRLGKGIALGFCKAARAGNKAFYYIGMTIFVIMSVQYVRQLGERKQAVVPAILVGYMIIVMLFVRRKSEREQRHIMHIRGEL